MTAPAPQTDRARHRQARVPAPVARPLAAQPGPWERITAGRWPLTLTLIVQAALSAHLIWANTAFTDEALYLTAGQLEWSRWLEGTPIAPFQIYFSGSPVIYPPLGAAANAVGGLAAARALSLSFMLMATVLLHGATRRIFTRRAASFAAALFAGIGATQYLGAFATYDALALTLLALATWLGVRAADLNPVARLIFIALSGLIMVLADATKYAAALFDPVVILVVGLAVWQRRGRGSALAAGLTICGATGLGLAGALLAGGSSYWQGIQFTTLSRADSTSPSFSILLVSLGWGGMVGVLALIGAATAMFGSTARSGKALGVILAGAVWLAPAEQARIHTFASLFKHVGFGQWFGAIVAGFALASITAAIPRAKAEAGLRASWATAAVCAVIGFLLATNQFASWPNISSLISTLRPMLKGQQRDVLATDDGNVIAYYLAADQIVSREFVLDEQAQWQAVFNGGGFVYKNPATGTVAHGLKAYNLAIKSGYFGVIALSGYRAWASADHTIGKDIAKDKDYRLAATIPYVASGTHTSFRIFDYLGHK